MAPIENYVKCSCEVYNSLRLRSLSTEGSVGRWSRVVAVTLEEVAYLYVLDTLDTLGRDSDLDVELAVAPVGTSVEGW